VRFKGERISDLAPHIAARRRRRPHVPGNDDLQEHERARQRHHRASSALQGRACSVSSLAPPGQADETLSALRPTTFLELLGLSSLAGEIAKNLPHAICARSAIAVGPRHRPSILPARRAFRRMNHDETMKTVEMVRRLRERG